MKRFIAFLGTVFAALHCVAAQDAEVERAETELRTATTQADMNDAARKLSHLWDVRLRAVEARIESKLSNEERKKFRNLQRHWKKQRTRDVQFHADLFKGGSIQPMIANLEYSNVTPSAGRRSRRDVGRGA
jgi:uncharacterized protein YecT (DUF1311 family)